MANLAEAIAAANALNTTNQTPLVRDPDPSDERPWEWPISGRYPTPVAAVPANNGAPVGLPVMSTLPIAAPVIGEVIGTGPNGPIYWGAQGQAAPVGVAGPSYDPSTLVAAPAPRPSGLRPLFPVITSDGSFIGGRAGRVIFAEIDNRQVSGIRFGTLPQVVMPGMRRP